MESIRKLRIFNEVYRTLNITRTAEKLFMTQPAVSRAILELEEEYSTKLFERYHHRLLPTEYAHQLYKRSIHIINSVDELGRIFEDHSDITLHLGATITIASILLPGILERYKKQQPSVNVHVVVANGPSLKEKLINNELDIALIEDAGSHDDLDAIPFYHDEMVLIFSPSHPLNSRKRITLNDLTMYPFLMREAGSSQSIYLEHLFAMENLNIQPAWQSTSTHAIINAAAAGLGTAILPSLLVDEALKNGKVISRPVIDTEMKRTYYIVTHKEKFFTPELTALRLCCLEEIERSPL